MPIYEYYCEDCKKTFEEYQSVNEKPLTKCKLCGGKLKKVFSPAGIIFKGSGFHVTDYAPKKHEEKKPTTTSKSESKKESNISKDKSTKD